MQSLKKPPITCHTFWHLSNIACQLVGGIVLARALAPEGMGELNLLQGLILMVNPLIELGTKGNLLRECKKADPLPWIRAASTITPWAGILAWAGILMWNPTSGWGAAALLLGCTTLAIENRAASTLLLQTNLHAKLQRDTAITAAGTGLRILCALTINHQQTLILALFAAGTAEAALRRISNNRITPKTPALDKEILKKLLRESLVLIPGQISTQISSTTNRFWIAGSLGLATLGTFGIASRQSIPYAIATALYYERHFGNPSDKLPWIYALVATLATATLAPLTPWIYGQAFAGATAATLWLLVPNTLTLLANTKNMRLVAKEKTAQSTIALAANAATTLVANATLIPTWGIPGAAMALTLGALTQLLLQKDDDNKEM